jgi:hypothetical protein
MDRNTESTYGTVVEAEIISTISVKWEDVIDMIEIGNVVENSGENSKIIDRIRFICGVFLIIVTIFGSLLTLYILLC